MDHLETWITEAETSTQLVRSKLSRQKALSHVT